MLYELDPAAFHSHNICFRLPGVVDVATETLLAAVYHRACSLRHSDPRWLVLDIDLPEDENLITEEYVRKLNLVKSTLHSDMGVRVWCRDDDTICEPVQVNGEEKYSLESIMVTA